VDFCKSTYNGGLRSTYNVDLSPPITRTYREGVGVAVELGVLCLLLLVLCLVGVRERLFREREFKLPWREAGPPNHLDDKVDSG